MEVAISHYKAPPASLGTHAAKREFVLICPSDPGVSYPSCVTVATQIGFYRNELRNFTRSTALKSH